MDTVSAQPSKSKRVELLRDRHQELATDAARTGRIPDPFSDDPAFAQLVKEKKSNASAGD